MDINGLNICEISRTMESYIAQYFTGYVLISDMDGMFSEVVRLAFEEIEALIPVTHKQSYNINDWFNGAAGSIELCDINSGAKESYTAMLLMDDAQTQALYLYVMKAGELECDENIILVKDFVCDSKGI